MPNAIASPFGTAVPTFAAALATGLYNLILGRAPQGGDLPASVARLNADGGNPRNLATWLMTCPEARIRDVTNLYQSFLGRPPDAEGLAAFVTSGECYEQIALAMIGTTEFLTLAAEAVAPLATPTNANLDLPALLLAAHNTIRQTQGKPPLVKNLQLQSMAVAHSLKEAQVGFEDHNAAGDGAYQARLADSGYLFAGAAENLAAGQPDVASVMAAWTSSPLHTANILGNFSDAGLAMAKGPSGVPFWVVEFGLPQ